MRAPRSSFSANVSSGSPPRSSLREAPRRARVPDGDLPTLPRRNVALQRVARLAGHTERSAPTAQLAQSRDLHRSTPVHGNGRPEEQRRPLPPAGNSQDHRVAAAAPAQPPEERAKREKNHCLTWVRRQQRESSVFQGWSELEPNYRSYQRSKMTSSH